MTRRLDVYLLGENIGEIIQLVSGKVIFAFNEKYFLTKDRATLSQSFINSSGEIIKEAKGTTSTLPPFFSNLLPEGQMRKYLADCGGVKTSNEFRLLELLGEDLPGAIEIKIDGDESILKDEQEREIEERLHDKEYHFSLAGIQLKFSAIGEKNGGLTIPASGVGGDWIVKLPAQNFSHIPENEWAMMHLAETIGISVPQTKLIDVAAISGLPDMWFLAENKALAVKRFDRGNHGAKIHIEDFAQVFNILPQDKYEKISYGTMARMVWITTGNTGLEEFIRRLSFSIIIGNGDMHLKNWSLIYLDSRTPSLAPAYDLLSTIPYLPEDGLALQLSGIRDMRKITIDHFERMAEKMDLPRTLVAQIAKDTAIRTKELWHQNMKHYSLPNEILLRINSHIINGF